MAHEWDEFLKMQKDVKKKDRGGDDEGEDSGDDEEDLEPGDDVDNNTTSMAVKTESSSAAETPSKPKIKLTLNMKSSPQAVLSSSRKGKGVFDDADKSDSNPWLADKKKEKRQKLSRGDPSGALLPRH